jgi:hypothetical protein
VAHPLAKVSNTSANATRDVARDFDIRWRFRRGAVAITPEIAGAFPVTAGIYPEHPAAADCPD